MRGGLRSAWFTWMYKGTVSKSGLRSALRFHGCFGKVVLNEQWSLIGTVFHQWLNCIGNVLVQKFTSSCMPVCEGLSLLFLSWFCCYWQKTNNTLAHTQTHPCLCMVFGGCTALPCTCVVTMIHCSVCVFYTHTHTQTTTTTNYQTNWEILITIMYHSTCVYIFFF